MNDQDVKIVLTILAESVAARLRENGFKCRVVEISVRDNGLFSFTRQRKINHAIGLMAVRNPIRPVLQHPAKNLHPIQKVQTVLQKNTIATVHMMKVTRMYTIMMTMTGIDIGQTVIILIGLIFWLLVN